MPSVIPYDPSIALGNIVDPAKLENLEKISEANAPIDVAENKMNELISLKRSIDNTIQELGSMHINTDELYEESREVGRQIEEAAVSYAKTKLEAKKNILEIKSASTVNASWESPLDYTRTEIKKMPLSADSMNMNVQYFSLEQNAQSAKTQSENIRSFISGEFKFLGNDFAEQASKAAASQLNSQYSRHDIGGTLVIAASCTHKDAALLAPCVIDVDKAINIWNAMYSDDTLKPDDPLSIIRTASEANTANERSMTIVSGATYGSCFVGMVHILNTGVTMSFEQMTSVVDKVQEQCKTASWFAGMSGGFGLDSQFARDIKNLLSTQNISSHCTITTKGSIPLIKSNNVKMAVKEFAQFDGASAMEKIAALQNATGSACDSMDKSAQSARTGQQMVSLQTAQIQGVLSGLKDIDSEGNKIIDINSMMNALDDYVSKALAGQLGMPINYYLKPITKSQLAQMWVNKYFPNNFLKLSSAEGEENNNQAQ
ncbi:MAG: hypothetical protein NC223_09890 [Butyrivibrio sp.]|nr:hypothetical protein [Butyrivibrio sp.]